ncbi:MAG: hypothetical protein J6N52_14885 [Clostridia bacterium]|nr:hypothetical protein [Clostridia bacterium]
MKVLKAAAGVIFALLAVMTSWVFAAAAPTEVSYASPVIDGKKDAVYELSEPIETKNVIAGATTENPSTAKVWLAWDKSGLYVYAEVIEATPANEASEEYKQDSIEIFTDEDNKKSTVIDSNDTQYRVTSLGSRTLGNAASSSFESSVSTITDGYTVEVKLPWLEILPADGTVIGFDVLVNDALGSVRQGMKTWNTTDNTNFISTKNYGEIKLVLGEEYVPWNAANPLAVSVNGYRLDCGDTPPVIRNDRALVPMRAIFEALNCGVAYNEAERAVYAIGSGKLIKIIIGSDVVYVNDEPQQLEAAAEIINDRTVVPLRFIAESLGAEVNYDERQGAIFILKL